ncbi:beta-carotene isomerase D27, chloroplastic [Selaginella moellendorffii]|uniref:beta-carotene isomerase D27, chloroplastic n=1 Tax=Selaginella moellendorffii TaxID=88036 RepID=UPI000D1CBE25|nr:beta-carotene isomerase D27, chloroplastic [Selaginella moellendorffii]|eukprot:XP_024519838.1 beta-carotene isomerase D27, chloroplastic [Selaginella moellendorffii]
MESDSGLKRTNNVGIFLRRKNLRAGMAAGASSIVNVGSFSLEIKRDLSRQSGRTSRACGAFTLKCRAAASGRLEETWKPAPMGQISSYNDSWLDKRMILVFVGAMSKISGKTTSLPGFDGFVDVARKMMQGRTPVQQHEMVLRVLESLMPWWIGAMIRTILPASRATAEFYAHGTTLFTSWLIGPSEVIEVEVDGVKQKTGVHIQKCRHSVCSVSFFVFY